MRDELKAGMPMENPNSCQKKALKYPKNVPSLLPPASHMEQMPKSREKPHWNSLSFGNSSLSLSFWGGSFPSFPFLRQSLLGELAWNSLENRWSCQIP